MNLSPPVILTIAGSDSGGGAGIQADIKAISATGGYACSVITALTAQNTCGVEAVSAVDPGFVRAQLDAVLYDMPVRAVKIGMLANQAIIREVAAVLARSPHLPVILDPVMVATSGDPLLDEHAMTALIEELIPRATVLTPNLPEAARLTGQPVPTAIEQMHVLVPALRRLGCPYVMLKGGHLHHVPESVDVWISRDTCQTLSARRVETANTHGTGCSLSAAIASFYAQGMTPIEAGRAAKHYLTDALAHSQQLKVGRGAGPVHHFYAYPVEARHHDGQEASVE
ncbi:bifunctional hydroxymethylpyrimidine kinase/phosphomethylpyrimidine kinase [Salinivibrio kushneri]|uniref:bifunctional hydroxymethylpyrimidine kinase/phosphomethylpyrimidine kinase n=1 Tax=Salinivibrio kushneri TaxID=1908198 RepID=UPI0009897B4C|nr:bifunctional hydroxymethylpyrimidine kinase/phosphomethylpyrimidine kinase [Salinivibrio kushneri]OOE35423.1 bifunctional hydroxymethylpyrimidine kinase/phosphomethylpyrimidine kinase [Salinivibrio kushneri]